VIKTLNECNLGIPTAWFVIITLNECNFRIPTAWVLIKTLNECNLRIPTAWFVIEIVNECNLRIPTAWFVITRFSLSWRCWWWPWCCWMLMMILTELAMGVGRWWDRWSCHRATLGDESTCDLTQAVSHMSVWSGSLEAELLENSGTNSCSKIHMFYTNWFAQQFTLLWFAQQFTLLWFAQKCCSALICTAAYSEADLNATFEYQLHELWL
jgi:hypothetical protein